MESDLVNQPHDYMFSIIIIGDQSVGKTSLMVKFADNQYRADYKPTIGIDFKVKKIKIGDIVIKLQVWDTAGQERFRTISQTYYQRADGVILAYDCTNQKSFESLSQWVSQLNNSAKKGVKKVIISTKCDVDERSKKVSREAGQKYAQDIDMPFYETSALNGTNIDQVFR